MKPRVAAARDVMAEAREFEATGVGRFYLFGSAATDLRKYDSDFDIVVDFPLALEMEAAEFVEQACLRRQLPCDVLLKSRASERFLNRIRDHILVLP